jgi:PAS domain S-box-containing protein
MPYSNILINTNGTIIDVNPRTSSMFSYTKEEMIGKKFNEIPVFSTEDNLKIVSLFNKFIKGEEVHREDLRIHRKDGSIIWANLQAAMIKIEDESYVEAIFNDVTPRKEAEFLVQEELEKLKELDQIRKNLISRVSHELKTPLVSVNGGYELLLTLYKDKFQGEELELIELIGKGAKRLKGLIDNLIDVSKIEYNKFKLIKKKQNLSEIVREISKELMFSIRERNLNLSLILPESLEIEVDRIRIEQVIMNLLTNAIKNTPPNGDIIITLKPEKECIELSVTDSGIGLTEKEMEMLFTRFGKIERYGKGFEFINIQGSGLGLYIAKEIVTMHEGEIKAESEGRNKGSTFTVKLPNQ